MDVSRIEGSLDRSPQALTDQIASSLRQSYGDKGAWNVSFDILVVVAISIRVVETNAVEMGEVGVVVVDAVVVVLPVCSVIEVVSDKGVCVAEIVNDVEDEADEDEEEEELPWEN